MADLEHGDVGAAGSGLPLTARSVQERLGLLEQRMFGVTLELRDLQMLLAKALVKEKPDG